MLLTLLLVQCLQNRIFPTLWGRIAFEQPAHRMQIRLPARLRIA